MKFSKILRHKKDYKKSFFFRDNTDNLTLIKNNKKNFSLT